jgi:hypothetical protein
MYPKLQSWQLFILAVSLLPLTYGSQVVLEFSALNRSDHGPIPLDDPISPTRSSCPRLQKNILKLFIDVAAAMKNA